MPVRVRQLTVPVRQHSYLQAHAAAGFYLAMGQEEVWYISLVWKTQTQVPLTCQLRLMWALVLCLAGVQPDLPPAPAWAWASMLLEVLLLPRFPPLLSGFVLVPVILGLRGGHFVPLCHA